MNDIDAAHEWEQQAIYHREGHNLLREVEAWGKAVYYLHRAGQLTADERTAASLLYRDGWAGTLGELIDAARAVQS